MKKWMKSPALWGTVILCLISAGIIVYMGTEINRTHKEIETLETQLSVLENELDELREMAENEDFVQKETAEQTEPVKPQTDPGGKPAQSQPVSKYVSESKVKESVLGDLQYDDNPEDLVFVSIILDESQEPPVYDVIAEPSDKYRKHIFKVNAETGLIRDRVFYNADNFEEEEQIGLYHERGDSSEPETWNQYWEMYCSPSGQAYYEGFPVIEIYTEEWYAYLKAKETKE